MSSTCVIHHEPVSKKTGGEVHVQVTKLISRVFIHDKSDVVNFCYHVILICLIQRQRKTRATSANSRHIDPHLFTFVILLADFFLCYIRYLNSHCFPPSPLGHGVYLILPAFDAFVKPHAFVRVLIDHAEPGNSLSQKPNLPLFPINQPFSTCGQTEPVSAP